MEEAKWLACGDLSRMLKFLGGRVSDRKLRLFCCACCRTIWPLFAEKVCRQAVTLSEAFAEGEAGKDEVDEAVKRLDELFTDAAIESNVGGRRASKKASLRASRMAAVSDALSDPVRPKEASAKVVDLASEAGPSGPTEKDHCFLLRELVGPLPFRSVRFDPALRSPAVLALATAAYENRELPSGHLDPERLAVLADALEESGCTDAEILSHLRGDGPHVRGCWCLDALLGRA